MARSQFKIDGARNPGGSLVGAKDKGGRMPMETTETTMDDGDDGWGRLSNMGLSHTELAIHIQSELHLGFSHFMIFLFCY
jgi:hypothetical protein